MVIRQKVLIIESDRDFCDYLTAILLTNDYEPLIAHTGEEGMSMILSHCPEVVLLELALPDMDGLEILASVREWSTRPIIIVSGRTDEQEKVTALDKGADDYITKPCGGEELLARIRLAIRHTRTASRDIEFANKGMLVLGRLKIDCNRRRVFIDNEDVNLTQNEYRMVELLGRYSGEVLTYEAIIKELWGPKASANNQILRVNMTNIRRKIEEDPTNPKYIITENGVGYRMISKEENDK